jgi:hypothetical protein
MSAKQAAFDESMETLQVQWRKSSGHVDTSVCGYQNGHQRKWILPREKWEQGLWPQIRSGTSHSLPDYMKRSGIQPHTGKHNLKSSWVLCANLYFPFGHTPDGKALLAGFLQKYVSSDIKSVDELHLEYAEDGDLSPEKLLGESGGSRGSGQTSPDLAFHLNGRKGLILIENKLTEHSFYPCSARAITGSEERTANPASERCENMPALQADHRAQCHQCLWGRKYWDILRPVMNKPAMSALQHCPAATAGYQLFRQQALAEGIAQSGKYQLVYSCVALDDHNDTLKNCLKSTGITDLESGWSALFNGKAHFKVFTHQQWVAWVRANGAPSLWQPWLDYVAARYGY